MFSRYFVCFCLVALFAVIAVSAAEGEAESRVKIPKSLIKKGAKILGKTFLKAAAGCLYEAAEACKDQIKHPVELVKCGGRYLEANKGRCLL